MGRLKGFTGVGTGRYESLGYFNAKVDWDINIVRSVYIHASLRSRIKSSFGIAAQTPNSKHALT